MGKPIMKVWDSTQQKYVSVPAVKGGKGDAGITPTIGSNGNWYLGTVDTGKPSRGEKGDTGPVGADGAPGAKGDTYTLTAADKQEIAELVLTLIPDGTEVSY